MKFIPASNPEIQYYGRWDVSDSASYRHSWPGVFIVAVFDGDSIGVRMADGTNYYDIYLDGRLERVFHSDNPAVSDYTLLDSLKPGRHTLRLSQRNISFGIYSFEGLLLSDSGSIYPPPAPPSRRIEFIGDSYTAAEGNEATQAEMKWEDKFPVTDIDSGFAAIVARHFDADYHVTARSGIGMVCDWQGKFEISMPHYFDRTLMESPVPIWNFKSWTPDLVVICLGLNDHSGLRDKQGKISTKNSTVFRKGYRKFLKTVGDVYPGIPILVVSSYEKWIVHNVSLVVDEEQDAGRDNIYFVNFGCYPGEYVANGHPDLAAHRQIAGVIIGAINAMKIFPVDK